NSWSTTSSMPGSRNGMGSAVTTGQLYAIGGDAGSGASAEPDVLNPGSPAATQTPTVTPTPTVTSTPSSGAIVVNTTADSTSSGACAAGAAGCSLREAIAEANAAASGS